MGSTTHTSARGSRAGPSSVSSESQPASRMARSRSRSSASTARSASLTGEEAPLTQLAGRPRNMWSASAPASRTAEARRSRSRARSMSSAGNGDTLHAHARRIGAETELQVVRRQQRLEHLDQVSGDRHFAHGVAALAVFDPESGSAAAVVAGHLIDADPDEIGDIEALGDVGHQSLRRVAAGGEMQVARAGRGRRGYPALGVAGAGKTEIARGRGVQDPRREHAVLDDGKTPRRNALGVERARAQSAPTQRIVDNVDARPEQPLPEPVLEEARLARHRSAIDGACEMADERASDPAVEHDRYSFALHLARIEPLDGALAGRASDLLRWIEVGAVERGGIVVVALHRGALAGDCRHRYALARAEVGTAKTVAPHHPHPADAGRGRGAARFGDALDRKPRALGALGALFQQRDGRK